ncbi:metalloregulator ArsR/SmtB family transcription factor [Cronobacter sakazakii]|uniref:ArsR/SmtB family transcription factor n=1 Tax=Cronobacter sakazakii TaxID=28141 RepID=UPI000B4B3D5F|nr:metalloregulator ArsR/SmtB family transcription factor [Cronobacter sakazakii]EKS1845209.1 metalloregulator ArsR/SmtB family transcription factor [Cronobacter muytjensii]EIV2968229.1 metalloregulator ArsR/SmtB family transcription factor [Cronobacter sakazakii]EJQ2006722.1 metalloregulator ArsR/SmtB family transcription factor [Cronobacter sakazakii]EJQ2087373.1 metalloregulator ArsR/SmtB family transcription factor [Cronobacter sakazakii]EJR9309035.1 metalloregulator ArsR/SmtB family trans
MNQPEKFLYTHLGELAKLLGHGSRIEILEHLSAGELSVEMLAALTGMSAASTSQHLQNLRRGNFVMSRREGKHIIYRLGDGPVRSILASLRCFAEFNNEVIRSITADYRSNNQCLEAVTREELLSRLETGSVTLLDVRPEEEYVGGHLPGALNIPLRELESRLAELPKDTEIVAYCRGPHCILSVEAVKYLRRRGFRIRRFDDGYPEWVAAGLQTEQQR